MMPRKRVASELARSSRRGLPRGLDGFDRNVPIGLEIGLKLGLCRGSCFHTSHLLGGSSLPLAAHREPTKKPSMPNTMALTMMDVVIMLTSIW